MKTMLCIGAAE